MRCSGCGYNEDNMPNECDEFIRIHGTFLIKKEVAQHGHIIPGFYHNTTCKLWACPKCGSVILNDDD